MQTFDFRPIDTLFCRDQRPIAAGNSYGRGANWPLPGVLHGALRAAFLRLAGELPSKKEGRKTDRFQGADLRNEGNVGSTAFDWLHLHGPFPVCPEGEVHFPTPADLLAAGESDEGSDRPNELAYLRLIPRSSGRDNLRPKFLTRLPAGFTRPTKVGAPEWISKSFFEQYLTGEPLRVVGQTLWDREHRIGVKIDAPSHTAVKGQLFGLEHLRPRDNVVLRFGVSDPPAHRAPDPKEAGLTPKALAGCVLQLGGERRFGLLELAAGDLRLPSIVPTNRYVKWVLLTPGVFLSGWCPGWIDDGDGRVMLRLIDREARRELRRRRRSPNWKYDPGSDSTPTVDARLVAARVPRPRVVGGWQILQGRDGGPRPTYLAVPAGAVFYLEAADEREAVKLHRLLHARCRSDFFGEKGFGLGVCGTWEHQRMDFEPALGR